METINEQAKIENKACPHCGYCPHCGRSNPYRTAPPWQPYTTPFYPPLSNWPYIPDRWVTWGDSAPTTTTLSMTC